MTPLLVCIIALIVPVVIICIICAAVKLFNFEHVKLSANVLKLVTFSFSVKGRGDQ